MLLEGQYVLLLLLLLLLSVVVVVVVVIVVVVVVVMGVVMVILLLSPLVLVLPRCWRWCCLLLLRPCMSVRFQSRTRQHCTAAKLGYMEETAKYARL